MEEPVTGQHDDHSQIDCDQQHQGEDHTGGKVAEGGNFGFAVDFMHDGGQTADGSGGKKYGQSNAGNQHGGGQVVVQIAQVVPEDVVHALGQQMGQIGQLVAQPHIDHTGKRGNANQNGEEGQDQKVGQLCSRAADMLFKVDSDNVGDKTHRPQAKKPFDIPLHRSASFLSRVVHSIAEKTDEDNGKTSGEKHVQILHGQAGIECHADAVADDPAQVGHPAVHFPGGDEQVAAGETLVILFSQ